MQILIRKMRNTHPFLLVRKKNCYRNAQAVTNKHTQNVDGTLEILYHDGRNISAIESGFYHFFEMFQTKKLRRRDKMKFNEFTETVRDGLAVLFEPDNMEVAVTRVVKNNGLILTGINIRDRNSMITPTIYIDDFYREDIQKEEIHTVVLRIKDIFTERCTKVSSDNEIQNYMDFNWVKNRLIYTVVNQCMNEEYLEHVPYIPFHDLAIIFRCVFHKGENGMASSTVPEDDLKRWHTDT